MCSDKARMRSFESLLNYADVKINGSRPWDIQVHNTDLYAAVLSRGTLGLGGGYLQGWWSTESLDQFFYHLLSARLDLKVKTNFTIIAQIIKEKLLNLQSKKWAFHIGERHYDLGNDLFEAMLDQRMVYTC